MPHRYQVVGAISLVLGGAAVLLQYIVTPLSGDMSGTELVAKVTEHHTAMGWALALDFPVLLAAPAFLFVGHLAQARTSVLASTATAFLFFPFVLSLPAAMGLDGLAFLAGADPAKAELAHLVDSWENSTWFLLSLLPYLLLQLMGSVLMAIALLRARVVPAWVALGTGVWPVLGVAGQESGVRVLGILGYALLFVTWTVLATSLMRGRRSTSAEPVLATA